MAYNNWVLKSIPVRGKLISSCDEWWSYLLLLFIMTLYMCTYSIKLSLRYKKKRAMDLFPVSLYQLQLHYEEEDQPWMGRIVIKSLGYYVWSKRPLYLYHQWRGDSISGRINCTFRANVNNGLPALPLFLIIVSCSIFFFQLGEIISVIRSRVFWNSGATNNTRSDGGNCGFHVPCAVQFQRTTIKVAHYQPANAH